MPLTQASVLDAAQRLQQRGEACALVTVLRVQAPASARPGDKAVVNAEGFVAGWIGGGCAQPAVLRTVKLALADGRSRLIRIAPSTEGEVRELQDVLEFGMACHSGGTLELFVDPLLPQARLVVVGDSPVAQALVALAPQVGFQVDLVAHGADATRFPAAGRVFERDDDAELPQAIGPGAFVIVATQGRRDVQGLRAALRLDARHIGFVASARKAGVLKASLIEAGESAEAVKAIVAPAGRDIGAQTPEEIALSVLAALVAARRGAPAASPVSGAEANADNPAPAGAAAARAGAAPEAMPAAATSQAATSGSCCGGQAAAPKPAMTATAATTAATARHEAGPTSAAGITAPVAAKVSCCGGAG